MLEKFFKNRVNVFRNRYVNVRVNIHLFEKDMSSIRFYLCGNIFGVAF